MALVFFWDFLYEEIRWVEDGNDELLEHVMLSKPCQFSATKV